MCLPGLLQLSGLAWQALQLANWAPQRLPIAQQCLKQGKGFSQAVAASCTSNQTSPHGASPHGGIHPCRADVAVADSRGQRRGDTVGAATRAAFHALPTVGQKTAKTWWDMGCRWVVCSTGWGFTASLLEAALLACSAALQAASVTALLPVVS